MTPQPVDEYEYVAVYLAEPRPSGIARYDVVDCQHGADLGEINWREVWRQYVFEPDPSALLFVGSLRDIAAFVEQATAAQLNGRLRPWKAEP